MHKGACGGHYMAKAIAHKIQRVGFWWPNMFKYSHMIFNTCDTYQRFTGKLKFSGNLPLRPVSVQGPFQQWCIDFIGEFLEKSSGGHS